MESTVKKGEIWWQPKGYFSVYVTDIYIVNGVPYIEFFNIKNSGLDYAEHAEKHLDPGMDGLKAAWFKENYTRVYVEERFLATFTKEQPEEPKGKEVEPVQTTSEFIPLDYLEELSKTASPEHAEIYKKAIDKLKEA